MRVSAISRYSLPFSAGVARKSDIRVLQNTRLPAPIIAIFAMLNLSGFRSLFGMLSCNAACLSSHFVTSMVSVASFEDTARRTIMWCTFPASRENVIPKAS